MIDHIRIARELIYIARYIKASDIEYKYSPASYNGNAFIVVSLFNLRMLSPDDASSIIRKAKGAMNRFVSKNHFSVVEQKMQRMFGKDCIVTIMNSKDSDMENKIKSQLSAEIYYHTRFD